MTTDDLKTKLNAVVRVTPELPALLPALPDGAPTRSYTSDFGNLTTNQVSYLIAVYDHWKSWVTADVATTKAQKKTNLLILCGHVWYTALVKNLKISGTHTMHSLLNNYMTDADNKRINLDDSLRTSMLSVHTRHAAITSAMARPSTCPPTRAPCPVHDDDDDDECPDDKFCADKLYVYAGGGSMVLALMLLLALLFRK